MLRSAGIESCDAVAAATPDDNLNITVCQIAKKIFGIENAVARISDPAREEIFSTLGLRCICHTNLACDALEAALIHPLDSKTLTFGTHTLSFVAIPSDKRMVGCLTTMGEGCSLLLKLLLTTEVLFMVTVAILAAGG